MVMTPPAIHKSVSEDDRDATGAIDDVGYGV